MNRKLSFSAAFSIIILIAALFSFAIWMITEKEASVSNNQNQIQTAKNSNSYKLQNFCTSKGGKLENWEENNAIKVKCKLSTGQLCDLDQFYSGQCPKTLKTSILEPGDCSAIANKIFSKFGKVKISVADFQKINISGKVCKATVAVSGSKIGEGDSISEKIQALGWTEINGGDGTYTTVRSFSKNSEYILFELIVDPRGGRDSEWAKKIMESCDLDGLGCFKDNDLITTMSLSLGTGYQGE